MSNASTSSEPKPSKLFTLRSNDNEEFELPESGAVLSETIKHIVEDGIPDDGNSPIPISEVDGKILAKVVEYLKKHGDEGFSDDNEKKKFDEEFLSGVDVDGLFELVMAANYLAVKPLLELLFNKIAGIMKDKSVLWARKTFSVENDFTPREEEAIRREYPWAWEDVEQDID